ncbi:MAG: glycosyltransferase [Candidatus Aenigmarchaeota archaeon]|nr:glycosyltransferase [Candidatus Aenigmarchaeota archaeon]
MKILTIIPCYNAEKYIESTISDIKKYQENILVIDDGSTDDSYNEMKKMKGVKILRHGKNRGKGAALKTGFNYALKNNFDAVITMDADGQHKASDIPKFIEKIDDFDIIIGNRMGDSRGMPLPNLISNRFSSYLVSRKSKNRIPDSQSGFRLIKKNIIESLDLNLDGYQMETEILLKAVKGGYKVGDVPILTIYGDQVSYISPLRVVKNFVRIMLKRQN